MRFFFLFPLLLSKISADAQSYESKYWGVKLGVVAHLGTHVNQFGLRINAYATYAFTQVNIENTTTLSLTQLGGRKKLVENRVGLGTLLLGGIKNINTDFIWGTLHHQTSFKNALGYTYLWYRDNRSTSQNSGGWTLQSGNFQLFFENDIFAGTGRDKYRTGHLQIAYQQRDYSFQLGVQLWTGETRGSVWNKTPQENTPNGYRSLEKLPFGKTSHGILYAGLNYHLPATNFLSARIGFDSEQVRHVFQNRISHDLVFLPQKVERKTPHYPRLNADGTPVFSKKEMRKTRFYSQFGVNPLWSY